MNTALKNIRRTPYQSTGLALILSLNFFIISVFALVSMATHSILNHFETRPQVIAYLTDEASPDQVNQIMDELSNTGKVKEAKYISKQQALELYKQSVGNDPLLLGTVTELGEVTAEILPASIEVSVNNSADFDQVVAILKNSPIVSSTPGGEKEIDFPKSVIKELISWTRALRVAGLALIAVLALVSVTTTTLMIGSKIASRRLEIKTMKLIGAGSYFILKPYLLESLLFSAASAFLGWFLAYVALLYSTPFLINRLRGILAFPVDPILMLILLGALVFLSLLLGLISGFFATLRFLNR